MGVLTGLKKRLARCLRRTASKLDGMPAYPLSSPIVYRCDDGDVKKLSLRYSIPKAALVEPWAGNIMDYEKQRLVMETVKSAAKYVKIFETPEPDGYGVTLDSVLMIVDHD